MTEEDLHGISTLCLPLAHFCIVLLLVWFKPGKLTTLAVGLGGLIAAIGVGYTFYVPQNLKAHFGFNPTLIYFMPYIEQSLVFVSVSWLTLLITGKRLYYFSETFEGRCRVVRHYPMDLLTFAVTLLIPVGNILILVQAVYFHFLSGTPKDAYLSLGIPVLLYGAMFAVLYSAVQIWSRFLERHQVPEYPAPVQHEQFQ